MFSYQQTVRFEHGGFITIDVRADDRNPLSPEDLRFVIDLAERSCRFEAERGIERARKEAAAKARAIDGPLCWPGFRPW